MFRLFSLSLVWLVLSVNMAAQSVASQLETGIAEFHGRYKFSKYSEIKFTDKDAIEPIIILHSSTFDIPVEMMLVLKSDTCITSLYHDDGAGSSQFKCSSGLELRAKYQCSRASCLLRGYHHHRGKWSIFFKYNSENISIAETLRFHNGQNTHANSRPLTNRTKMPDVRTTSVSPPLSGDKKEKNLAPKSNTTTSADLTTAQKQAESLRQELADLKARQEQQQQTISNDTKLPTITIASATNSGAQGIIRGRVNDDTGVAELLLDGQKIAVDSNGNFSATTYVPEGGTNVNIEAVDLAGLSSTLSVRVDRAATQSASISFDRLNPLKREALPNKDAIALIIGIGTYENIIDAAYADKDALVFRDYATEKLGIPGNQIKTLINKEADIGEVLLGIRKWIRRSTKPDKTDVYVFYAGHGIATAIGEAYILPYDGRPEVDLLDRTALLQKELFTEIDKANPRNVIIFLDACYTGKARTGEVLMADANYRPIAVRPIDDGMPDNFTLITASSGDEFSGPLEEAKHGMFSYFLMKGMEGDADGNRDDKITSGELHKYVKENVLRQSADKQTPELRGNAHKVLVTFK